jgi:anti-sigma regulatory factor (Ser/Thr protein kinase)
VIGGAVSEFSPPWAGRAPGTAEPVSGAFFCVSLPTADSSPCVARHQAQDILVSWHVSRDDTATALLLISELVTNAARFGKPPSIPGPAEIMLAVSRLRDLLVIEVSDQSPELPVRRPADWESESGRGLNLVSELSREWHYYVPHPGWKTVYCVIALTGPASAKTLSLTAGRLPDTAPGGGE